MSFGNASQAGNLTRISVGPLEHVGLTSRETGHLVPVEFSGQVVAAIALFHGAAGLPVSLASAGRSAVRLACGSEPTSEQRKVRSDRLSVPRALIGIWRKVHLRFPTLTPSPLRLFITPGW